MKGTVKVPVYRQIFQLPHWNWILFKLITFILYLVKILTQSLKKSVSVRPSAACSISVAWHWSFLEKYVSEHPDQTLWHPGLIRVEKKKEKGTELRYYMPRKKIFSTEYINWAKLSEQPLSLPLPNHGSLNSSTAAYARAPPGLLTGLHQAPMLLCDAPHTWHQAQCQATDGQMTTDSVRLLTPCSPRPSF